VGDFGPQPARNGEFCCLPWGPLDNRRGDRYNDFVRASETQFHYDCLVFDLDAHKSGSKKQTQQFLLVFVTVNRVSVPTCQWVVGERGKNIVFQLCRC